MKLQDVLNITHQWKSVDLTGEYIGILTQDMERPLYYENKEDIPTGFRDRSVEQIEICTSGRVIYHLV